MPGLRLRWRIAPPHITGCCCEWFSQDCACVCRHRHRTVSDMQDAAMLDLASHEDSLPGRQRTGSPQKPVRASRRQFRVQGRIADDGCSLNLRLRITSPDGEP